MEEKLAENQETQLDTLTKINEGITPSEDGQPKEEGQKKPDTDRPAGDKIIVTPQVLDE